MTTIELAPGDYPGTYYVTVNDDAEHRLSQVCLGRGEALDALMEVIDELAQEGDQR